MLPMQQLDWYPGHHPPRHLPPRLHFLTSYLAPAEARVLPAPLVHPSALLCSLQVLCPVPGALGHEQDLHRKVSGKDWTVH